jgi:hypothetical protein
MACHFFYTWKRLDAVLYRSCGEGRAVERRAQQTGITGSLKDAVFPKDTLECECRLNARRSVIMPKTIVAASLLAAALLLILMQPLLAADKRMPEMGKAASTPTAADQKLINSAMQAAPKKVAAGATIVVAEADGKMRTLRQGTNGFTCMPDNPATPGPDPMCMDQAAMDWAGAWMSHKTPPSGKIGFMYMLEGGTDASNTDPFATKPTAENHWIKTGPHVMIVGADQSFYDMYPKNPAPDTAVPYIMWAGTPYQHLMIPVK